jgi:hypothetical protein
VERAKLSLERVKPSLDQRLERSSPENTTQGTTPISLLESVEPEFDCPVCADAPSGFVTVYVGGKAVGARRCVCKTEKIIEQKVGQIPREFGVPELEEIEPRVDLHKNQPAAIAYMRQHPTESYLLVGTNGSGKTFLAYALYVRALRSNRRVVALTVQELLNQYRRMEMGEKNAQGERFLADVTMEQLTQNREPWTILLDEFEKARPTEFACEALFALVDAAWKHSHQLIVTSNMSMDGLIDKWSAIDEVYGRSMAKRIAGMCKGFSFF